MKVRQLLMVIIISGVPLLVQCKKRVLESTRSPISSSAVDGAARLDSGILASSGPEATVQPLPEESSAATSGVGAASSPEEQAPARDDTQTTEVKEASSPAEAIGPTESSETSEVGVASGATGGSGLAAASGATGDSGLAAASGATGASGTSAGSELAAASGRTGTTGTASNGESNAATTTITNTQMNLFIMTGSAEIDWGANAAAILK